MGFPCGGCIETLFDYDPMLSALMAGWEISHNFYRESLGNFLRYSLI